MMLQPIQYIVILVNIIRVVSIFDTIIRIVSRIYIYCFNHRYYMQTVQTACSGDYMETGLKILMGVSIIGVVSLILMMSAMAPAINPANGNPANQIGQNPIDLGTGQANNGKEQLVEVTALETGIYDKQEIRVKAGSPVRFRFKAQSRAGCGMQLVIPDFGVNMVSRNEEVKEAVFTPTQKGVYPYRCGMNMFRGKMYVE